MSAPPVQGLSIVPMVPDHWPAVRAIYEDGIATGQATFETAVPSWDAWDRAHHDHSRFIARLGEDIVAWAGLSPVSGRAVYRGVAEVSVYVVSSARGRGVGRALLEHLVRASETRGIWTLQAVVFPENRASVAVHEGCGFRQVGRRERIGRLHGVWRDTVLLERRSAVVE